MSFTTRLTTLTALAAAAAATAGLAGPAHADTPNTIRSSAFVCVKDGPADLLKCQDNPLDTQVPRGSTITLDAHVTAGNFTGNLHYTVSADAAGKGSFRITRLQLVDATGVPHIPFTSSVVHPAKSLVPRRVTVLDSEVFNDPRGTGSRVSVSLSAVDLTPGQPS